MAKTVTAPLSRLTILFQVHSLVTTKFHRPKFAMSIQNGFEKIIERGGFIALWKGNMTSVLHRFPYSAINFYVYETAMDVLAARDVFVEDEIDETPGQLARRMTSTFGETTLHKFLAGALAGTCAVTACYPLDLIRTRLSTELEGKEHYRGIVDAFQKIYKTEGVAGFYAGIAPTLLVRMIDSRFISYFSHTIPGGRAQFFHFIRCLRNTQRIHDRRRSILQFTKDRCGWQCPIGGPLDHCLWCLQWHFGIPRDLSDGHDPSAHAGAEFARSAGGTPQQLAIVAQINHSRRIVFIVSGIDTRTPQGHSHGWYHVSCLRTSQRISECFARSVSLFGLSVWKLDATAGELSSASSRLVRTRSMRLRIRNDHSKLLLRGAYKYYCCLLVFVMMHKWLRLSSGQLFYGLLLLWLTRAANFDLRDWRWFANRTLTIQVACGP